MDENKYTVILESFDLKKGIYLLRDPETGTLEEAMNATHLWAGQENVWLFGAIVAQVVKGGKLVIVSDTGLVQQRKRRYGRTPADIEATAIRHLEKHPRPRKTDHSAFTVIREEADALNE